MSVVLEELQITKPLSSANVSARAPVRVATSLPGVLSTSFAAGSVVDNVTLVTGDRILIKNQTNAVENGIYTVSATGLPVRTSDADTGSSFSGVVSVITDGLTLSGTSWICSNSYNSGIVSVNALTFASYTGPTSAREPVRVATIAPGVLSSYISGAFVDNVTLATGDRILVKNQVTATENGVYIVQTAGAPIRSQDCSVGYSMSGTIITVTDGSINANTTWLCTNTYNTGIIGTNSLLFSMYTLPGGTKAPVRVATTVPGTLSTSFAAGQTIDNVSLVVGDRILLKNQVSGLENGVYTVQATGAPLRALDAPSGSSFSGYTVSVTNGTLNAGSVWFCTNAYAIGVIATNALTFVLYPLISSSCKLPVRAATTSAGALSSYITGTLIDNVTLAAGDRILVKNQTVASENGVYIVSAGAPVRSNDAVSGSSMSGYTITVTDGTVNAATNWQCSNTQGNGVIAANALTFVQNDRYFGTGFKLPVRATTTTNGTLATAFAAGQVIDTVQLAVGDRILIRNQTIATENGVYIVQATGAPVRASDAATRSIMSGMSIAVTDGTNAGSVFMSTNAYASGVVGVHALTFTKMYPLLPTKTGILLPVRVATTAAGVLAVSFAAGQIVDSVTLVAGDRILIKDQTTGSENGVYVVQASGAPVRASDAALGSSLSGMLVQVTDITSELYKCDNGYTSGIVGVHKLSFSYVKGEDPISDTGGCLKPVRVATTMPGVLASAFTAGQTIDSVTLTEGDRILIKDQVVTSENGVFIVQASGAPVRVDAGCDIAGVRVYVSAGSVSGSLVYICDNAYSRGISGVDGLVFSVLNAETGSLRPVRVATVTSGVLASSFAAGQVIDSVTLQTGDRILIQNQVISSENGVYTVTGGVPIRARDCIIGKDISGISVTVTEGSVYSGYVFKGTTPGVIGSGPLSFDTVYPITVDSGTKAPVIAATTTAVTLTSLTAGSVIDNVTLTTGDRILVKNQTAAVENGVYIVTDSTPIRSSDAAAGVSFSGVCVPITQGTLAGGTVFMCSNAYASGVIALNALTFVQISPSTTGSLLPVRVATTGAGTLATSFAAGRKVDSVTLQVGNRILIKNQVSGAENGVYTVNASGAPTRTVDAASGSSMSGCTVFVTDGVSNGGCSFMCSNAYASGVISLNALTFIQSYPVYNGGAKLPVRAATTVTGALASAFAAGQVIDTVTLATGNRILIKNQANGVENGLYMVNATGAPSRLPDAAAGMSMSGMSYVITDGAVNGDTQWICTNTYISGIIATHVLTFSLLASTGKSSYYTGISDTWKLSDIQASGVSGGNPTAANTWNTRTLNSLATSNNKATSLAITNILASVFTTASAHSFAPGDSVLVSMTNTVPSTIGNFTILSTPSATTFTLNNGSGATYNITSVIALTGFVARYTSYVELTRPGNNTFTLQPGSYRIQATTPGFRIDAHKCRLYNVTNGVVIGYGTNAYTMDNAYAGVSQSDLDAYVTITVVTVYRIEHAATGLPPLTLNGFGVAAGMSTIETYTTVSVTKLA